jgi:uncharacterized membrane protein
MNSYFKKIKENCISGILFLLPVLILLILIKKVFGYFARFGGGIAKIIGLDEVMGPHAADFMGALILFAIVYLCGYLVRLAFFKKVSDSIDSKLKEVIPGYEKHKELATKQLAKEPKIETDLPVLIQFGDYWQPGFLIEQDEFGNAVVVVPNSVSNQIFIVPIQKIKLLKETSLSTLKTVVNSSGKGLLVCK